MADTEARALERGAASVRARAERAIATERYQDEARYVPYFWWARTKRPLMRIGDVWLARVTPADVALFPELTGISVVAIRQTDGRVHETSAEDALGDWMRGR